MDRVEKRAPWRDHDNWSDSALSRYAGLRTVALGRVPSRADRHAGGDGATRRVGEPRRGAARRRARGGARRGTRGSRAPIPQTSGRSRAAPSRTASIASGSSAGMQASVPQVRPVLCQEDRPWTRAHRSASTASRSGARPATHPRRSSHPDATSSSLAAARRSSASCRDRAGAPTLLLLHGWVATGGLNWFQTFDTLGEHFRVIAPDLRGHGRGLRSRRVFRLADCADDCAATLVELGTGPVIAVGYSMGGPIAQLLWKRHRDLVSGLVLCATSGGFIPNRRARLPYQSAMLAAVGAARVATMSRADPAVPGFGICVAATARRGSPTRCAATTGATSSRPATRSARITRAVGSARSTCRPRSCARPRDRGVRPELQLAIADAIPGATVHPIDDGHLACAQPGFTPVLLERVHQRRPPHRADAAIPARPDTLLRTSAGGTAAPSSRSPSRAPCR